MEGVCRVCLAGDRKTYSVANTTLEQTYDVVTGVKLQRAGRPVALCCVCVSQLRRCRTFVHTARESNDVLDRWYQNHTHTDLKFSEQPLFTLRKNQVFQITYDGALESGIKQEEIEPHNGISHKENFKHEVTFDNIQSELTFGKQYNSQKSNDKKDNVEVFDDEDYTYTMKMEDCVINKCVWLPLIDAPKQRRLVTSNTDTASTHRVQRNMFSCSQCSYKTSKRSDFKRHSIKHTSEKPFACNQCDFKCTRKSNLKKHLLSHNGEIPFMCEKCDYKSNSERFLIKHLITHSDKPYKCDKCDYKCKRKSDMRKHLLTHTNDNPFSCDKCDYKCKQKSNLKMHLLTHTTEKPFACDKCGFNCNLKKNLRIHLMTHTDEKPFMCDKCHYKCRQNSDLKKHLMIHTGEKPFACDKCNFKCSLKAKLKRHAITHNNTRINDFKKNSIST